MKEFWLMIQAVFTGLGGWIGYYLGGCDGLLYALIAFVIVDYLTGVMCAIADKKLSSNVGFKGICRKVLIFLLVGIANIDLRRKVSRKIPRKLAHNYRKRQERSYLRGRSYADYKAYIENFPNASVVEMDTVYNDVSHGPFMQTFKFLNYYLMVAVYHDTKTAQDMLDGVNLLNQVLGDALFKELFEVLLTDRGDEFTLARAMETGADGSQRCHVFYCDPMQSGQKGSLEVNHEELRYICPHRDNLRDLGLVNQTALNFAISNIASSAHPAIGGKSPIEYTRFMKPELWEKLQTFGIQEIPRDDIDLTKHCLERFKKNPGEGSQA